MANDGCLTEEMLKKSWTKRNNLLWGGELPEQRSLGGFLQRLTRDELAEIRRSLQLKGASSLKKGELVELLSASLCEGLTELLCGLDKEQYELVRLVADSEGEAVVDESLIDEQVLFFRQRGLLFSGKRDGERCIVLPEELLKAFLALNQTEIKRKVQLNSEYITLVQGMLHYYGAMTLTQIMEQLKNNGYLTDDFTEVKVAGLLRDNAAPWSGMIAFEKEVFFHLLADHQRVMSDHALRPTLDWRRFSKAELCQAGKSGFVEKTDAFLRLAEFIKEYYAITQAEAEGLAEECVYAINDGYSLTELVELLQESLEMDSDGIMQDFVALLTYLTNNTRQWGLKGHTPSELSIRDLAYKNVLHKPLRKAALLPEKPKETGRNEPCPCGSGKKFKKCCAK